ncbi:MAG TPA: multiheme c-type cytochrome, partial [Gammaproteobacteria bacterium]|nr:multiheme c-type cytochrome [Gammaproteobacteria bacterium]
MRINQRYVTAGLAVVILWMLAIGIAPANAAKPVLPQYAAEKHMGVASCSNSLCHGSASERHTTPVLQNEYLIWQRQDAHSDAFATLTTPEALAITRKLGLGDPVSEALCLDCHTDNPAPAQRGDKFLLSDGIGCEACHGGAENWLASHTAPETTHADNLAAGMYPTADPQARAALCQSCHVGHPKKPMRHKLLGAGHPPLLFELDTYTANLPPHYQVDTDYKQRKPTYAHLDWWAQGQISAAKATLRKLKLYGDQRYHGFPEFALYECDTCHHSIEPGRALRSNFTGLPRLNDVHLRLVGTILAATDTALFEDWQQTVATLHKNPTNRAQTIARLEQLLAAAQKLVSQPDFWQPNRTQGLKRILLNPQGPVYLADFDTARQVVMALGALQAQQINSSNNINYNNLDDLYKAVSQRKT